MRIHLAVQLGAALRNATIFTCGRNGQRLPVAVSVIELSHFPAHHMAGLEKNKGTPV